MFTNLPKEFPVSALSDFNFGDPEAKEDPLLEQAFCQIKPVQEFLQSSGKAIVLGERGCGKSALFRSIKEGRMAFKNENKLKQIYVPIDEDLEYFGLNEFLRRNIKEESGKETERFRIAWELFILNRVLFELRQKFKGDKDLDAIEKEFSKSIGLNTNSKVSILELLKGMKKTFGVKIENGHTGMVIPNFYTSIEPSSNTPLSQDDSSLMLDTVTIKGMIRDLLKRNKSVVYVLIDKLDEFVINEEYALQKTNLQSLLETQRGYQAYPEIKVKLFLRTDLFNRLDFQSLGYDKISSKTVELKWSDADIRQFIAKRILINMFGVFGSQRFKFTIDNKRLNVDLQILEKADKIDEEYLNKKDDFLYKIKKCFNDWMILRSLKRRDVYDARKTDLTDLLNKAVITLFYPSEVYHFTRKKQKEQIDIFQFLSTHFLLGSGSTTPRIVLMYFQNVLENTREYFRANPDTRTVALNVKGEYPLFYRDSMLQAYEKLQRDMWMTCAHLSSKWKDAALTLKESAPTCNKSVTISFNDIASILKGVVAPAELASFIAFYHHVGLIKCLTPLIQESKRNYEFPILFQKLQ